ncbi:MAG: 50S ribosomal protein L18 [Balneolaceae bacterium]|jgi:large subunit ribosomal protein L18|nr:50S ribosomal protein L18 [Balneolaceae bacterium]
MNKNIAKTERRTKIRKRIRSTISGTPECPRISVYKSNKQLYVQLIDDVAGVTLGSSSAKSTVEGGKEAGASIAQIALDKGIKTAVYDRSGYEFHGIIKAVADAAREAGLDF